MLQIFLMEQKHFMKRNDLHLANVSYGNEKNFQETLKMLGPSRLYLVSGCLHSVVC